MYGLIWSTSQYFCCRVGCYWFTFGKCLWSFTEKHFLERIKFRQCLYSVCFKIRLIQWWMLRWGVLGPPTERARMKKGPTGHHCLLVSEVQLSILLKICNLSINSKAKHINTFHEIYHLCRHTYARASIDLMHWLHTLMSRNIILEDKEWTTYTACMT